MTRFWLVPGMLQTLQCVKRSVSFPLFPFPVDVLLLVLLVDTFAVTGVAFDDKGGIGGGGGSLGNGGGDVISVLVDVATNI